VINLQFTTNAGQTTVKLLSPSIFVNILHAADIYPLEKNEKIGDKFKQYFVPI
jgi:hypothetical protein